MPKAPRYEFSKMGAPKYSGGGGSGSKSRDFHYLSEPHNRFRLIGDPIHLKMHMDKEGFTRCPAYNVFTDSMGDKSACRKCSSGIGYTSDFWCYSAKNIDTGKDGILPLNLKMMNELDRVREEHRQDPTDLKKGFSIDIIRMTKENKSVFKMNKVKDHPLTAEDIKKAFDMDKYFGFDDEDGEDPIAAAERPDLDNGDDLNLEKDLPEEGEAELGPEDKMPPLPEDENLMSDDDFSKMFPGGIDGDDE